MIAEDTETEEANPDESVGEEMLSNESETKEAIADDIAVGDIIIEDLREERRTPEGVISNEERENIDEEPEIVESDDDDKTGSEE